MATGQGPIGGGGEKSGGGGRPAKSSPALVHAAKVNRVDLTQGSVCTGGWGAARLPGHMRCVICWESGGPHCLHHCIGRHTIIAALHCSVGARSSTCRAHNRAQAATSSLRPQQGFHRLAHSMVGPQPCLRQVLASQRADAVPAQVIQDRRALKRMAPRGDDRFLEGRLSGQCGLGSG